MARKHKKLLPAKELDDRINRACFYLVLAARTKVSDEFIHWNVDQAVHVLKGDQYEELVRYSKDGEEGPDTDTWHTGV